ncbi:MAG: energy transducer TonB [Acidobacteria bacterium]|nr:energy transducer TonB [Acidobacteriota bacterium]
MSLNFGRLPFLSRSRPAAHGTTRNGESEQQFASLSIRPESFGPRDVRFLLGATEERMGRSLAASLAGHVVGGLLVALIISLTPEPVYELIIPARDNYSIVWLPEEGPGGGGGGGGNESLELPQLVELPGADETPLSVPIPEEPAVVEQEPEPETLSAQQMNIPAVSMASAERTRSGVLDALAGADTGAQGSGTGGGAGSGEGAGSGPGTGSGLGPGTGGGVGGGVYRPGAGIVNPRVLREVKPQYTSEALRAKVTGTVILEVVVLPDGTVGDVRVTRSLDPVFGLDEEAIKAARQWLFDPATRFGEPVALLVSVALDFNLR